MGVERNKGYVEKTRDGYIGQINIEGCVMNIFCTFWLYEKPPFLYIERCKKLKFDEKNKSFIEYIPKPIVQIKATKTRKDDNLDFRGSFMFLGFKYDISLWWEDKDKKVILMDVERNLEQVLLKRINELLIDKK